MKSIFIFILFLLSFPLAAQVDTTYTMDSSSYVNPESTYSSARYRKEKLEGNKFDEKKWNEVVDDLNYQEEKEKEEPKTEEPKKGNNFNFSVDPFILRVVSFIVVFVLFAFILYYVAQNTRFKQKIKKNMVHLDAAAPVENIEEMDIEGLLQQALASGDLRMAVRIHYLLLLKKLNEVGFISWKKDKTNRDYLSELYGRDDYYDHVSGLTLAYELVWYGERNVSTESFQKLSDQFESVSNKINKMQADV